jgi:hypothetical protein
MAKSSAKKPTHHQEKTFKFDGAFIKREAKDALTGYFMPFSGLYAAATGKKVVLVRDKDGLFRQEPSESPKKRA